MLALQVEEILNRLHLPHQSINATIYTNYYAVIMRVKLYPNITYTTDNIAPVHSTITGSSSIAGCHIIKDSVFSAVYISNG